MRIPKHVSGLLISLWEPAYSLFVRDKYVTPTGKRLRAGYVQKAEARKIRTIVCVCVCVNVHTRLRCYGWRSSTHYLFEGGGRLSADCLCRSVLFVCELSSSGHIRYVNYGA